MKKLNYLIIGLGAMVLASCSQDDLDFNNSGDGTYTVTVNLPANLGTRSLGDGLTATELQYAIYDSDGNFMRTGSETFPSNALSTQVTLNLVSGATFQIAFFAQSEASMGTEDENYEDAVYNFDGEGKTLTVNYENMTSTGNNADDYDCFYELHNTGVIGSNTMNTSVTLVRPIAKINWGTNDMADPIVVKKFGENGANLYATLSVEAYNTFNLFTKALSNSTTATTPVEIGPFTPDTGATYPVTGTPAYTYAAMQYVLAPQQSQTYDLTLTIANSADASTSTVNNSIDVSNAPIQANYQTNIYGTLLTDQVQFNVTKSAEWGTPANNIAIWDGVTTSEPQKNSDGAYVINNPGEWVWLTKNPTSTPGYPGRLWNTDIVLNANLDFAGNEVQGIYYTGNFNGQGYTIKNLTIIPKSSYACGFFAGDIGNGDELNVENLNFDNVKINNSNPNSTEGWAAVVIADIQNYNVTLTNVNVSNSEVIGNKCVAGLVGFVASGRTLTVNDCSVSGCTISNIPVGFMEDGVVDGSGFVAGMVGRVVGNATYTNSTVSNTTVNGYWTAKYGNSTIQQIQGLTSSQTIPTGVTADNVTVNNLGEVILGATANGQSYSSLEEAISLNPSGATIQLGVGSYATPTSFGSGKYILKGMGQDYTIVEANNPTWNDEGGTIEASDLTFKSFVNPTNHTHMAFTGATNQTFTNVTFNGEFHVTSGDASFTNCTFNYDKASGTNYQLWCETSGTVSITNCTMNCNDGKAILVYGESADATGGNVNVNGLTVTSIGNTNNKGVVEIHSENYIQAETININNVTYPASYFTSGLWREINNNSKSPNYEKPTHYYTIYVNGVIAQTGDETGAQPTGN